ncbi:hypothetical protein, partial [Rhizobium leguminosarum]|uniref:hypothetical protein n=1 Tax=Rhizobium leguminosarum TaxID=384 RepID=UPI001AECC805
MDVTFGGRSNQIETGIVGLGRLFEGSNIFERCDRLFREGDVFVAINLGRKTEGGRNRLEICRFNRGDRQRLFNYLRRNHFGFDRQFRFGNKLGLVDQGFNRSLSRLNNSCIDNWCL